MSENNNYVKDMNGNFVAIPDVPIGSIIGIMRHFESEGGVATEALVEVIGKDDDGSLQTKTLSSAMAIFSTPTHTKRSDVMEHPDERE